MTTQHYCDLCKTLIAHDKNYHRHWHSIDVSKLNENNERDTIMLKIVVERVGDTYIKYGDSIADICTACLAEELRKFAADVRAKGN